MTTQAADGGAAAGRSTVGGGDAAVGRDAAGGRPAGDRVASLDGITSLDGIDGGGAGAASAPVARLGAPSAATAIGADTAAGPPVELGQPESAEGPTSPPVATLPSTTTTTTAAGADAGAEDSGPVALFDTERIGADRTDVRVADLRPGGSASRRRRSGEDVREVGARGRPRRSAAVEDAEPEPIGDQIDGLRGGSGRGGRRRGRRERIAAPAGAEPALDAGEGEPGGEEQPGGRAREDRPSSRRGGGRRPGGRAELDPDVDPVAVAREICLRLLTDRARTRQELAQALQRKGVPDEASRAVLDRFDEVGLIDDAAFAGQWARSRHAHRGLARRAIAMELRRKGVSDEDAVEALAEVDPESEEQRARELVDRKLRTLAVGTAEKRAAAGRRLVGMLARKGYGAGVAYRVVKDALAERGAEVDELGDAELPEE